MTKFFSFCTGILLILLISSQAALATDTFVAGYAEDLLAGINMPDSTMAETPLGRVAADAAAFAAECDVAIIGGGAVKANLRGGEITYDMLRDVFPDDICLIRLQLSSVQLKELLEFGVSRAVFKQADVMDWENSSTPFFPQVSGVSFIYDISAPVGQRVCRMELDAPTADSISVVVSEEYLAAAGVSLSGDSVCTEYEALCMYFERSDTVHLPTDSRILLRGVAPVGIRNYLPQAAAIILVFFALTATAFFRKNALSVHDITDDQEKGGSSSEN